MNSRVFWIIATAAFVLLWFVLIPYLAANPYIDMTAPTIMSWQP